MLKKIFRFKGKRRDPAEPQEERSAESRDPEGAEGSEASKGEGEEGAGEEGEEEDSGDGEPAEVQSRAQEPARDGDANAGDEDAPETPRADEEDDDRDPDFDGPAYLGRFAKRVAASKECSDRRLLERALWGMQELGQVLGEPGSSEDLLPALLSNSWRLRDEFHRMRSEFGTLEQINAALDEQIAARDLEIEALRTEIAELRQEADELETLRAYLQREIGAGGERQRELEDEANRLVSELERWKGKEASTMRRLRGLVASMSKSAGHVVETSEVECMDETLDLGKEHLRRLVDELDWRRDEMRMAQSRFATPMWRFASGMVRRVRTWSDGGASPEDDPLADELSEEPEALEASERTDASEIAESSEASETEEPEAEEPEAEETEAEESEAEETEAEETETSETSEGPESPKEVQQ